MKKKPRFKITGKVIYIARNKKTKTGTVNYLFIETNENSDIQGKVKVAMFYNPFGKIPQIMKIVNNIKIPHSPIWTGDEVEIIGTNYNTQYNSVVFESGLLIKPSIDINPQLDPNSLYCNDSLLTEIGLKVLK